MIKNKDCYCNIYKAVFNYNKTIELASLYLAIYHYNYTELENIMLQSAIDIIWYMHTKRFDFTLLWVLLKCKIILIYMTDISHDICHYESVLSKQACSNHKPHKSFLLNKIKKDLKEIKKFTCKPKLQINSIYD